MSINFQILNNPTTSPATRADVQKYFANLEAGLPGDQPPVVQNASTYTLKNLTNPVDGEYLIFEFVSATSDFTYAGTVPTGGTVTTLNVYAGTKVGNDIIGATLWASITPVSWDADDLFNAVASGNAAAFDAIFYGQDNFVYTGGTGKDSFTGGIFGDILDGGAGNDALYGDKGDDTFLGGAGADTYDGGVNDSSGDTVDYSLTANTHAVIMTLGAANANASNSSTAGSDAAGDLVKNVENIIGGSGKDKLTGNTLNNRFEGRDGDDTLTGGSGDDHLIGGQGNDILIGGAGFDRLDGTVGIDTVSYAASSAGVTIDLGLNDNGDVNASGKQSGGDADGDRLSQIDTVIGSAKNDIIKGSTLNETFIGGAGADSFDGVSGNDTVSYAGETAGVIVNLFTNSGTAGNAKGDTFANIDNLIGGKGNDVLTGDGNANELIYGADGNDTIEGRGGSDNLVGGLGTDTLTYANSAAGVTVSLSKQGATLATGEIDTGNPNPHTQSGGDAQNNQIWGFENLTGSGYDDILSGSGTANTLDGGAGIDTLDYSYIIDSAKNVTVALGAYDTKTGNVGQTKTSGNTGDFDNVRNFENVTGGGGNDKLTGNSRDNILNGGGGNDTLTGADGDDTLIGFSGADTFIGGLGADIMIGGENSTQEGIYGDTVDYSASNAAISIQLIKTNFGQAKGGYAEGDQLAGILGLIGSKYDDVLRADVANNTFGVKLSGGAGDDIIQAGKNDMYESELDGGTNGAAGDTLDYAWASNAFDMTITLSNVKDAWVEIDNEPGAGTKIRNFENIISGKGDDVLTGNNVNNVIEGGAGADQMVGGLGNDTVSYASSSSAVTVWFYDKQGSSDSNGNKSGFFAPTAQEGGDAQGDLLWGFENIIGSANNDFIVGNDSVNVLKGGAGSDKLTGVKGDDVLYGEAGNDTFEAGGDEMGLGKDTMDGGADIDTVDYSAESLAFTVTLGKDGASATVSAGKGSNADDDKLINIENVTGGSGDDKITGNNLANALTGSGGNDTLVGAAGADILDGGNDFDTISYALSAAGVTVNLTQQGTYNNGDPEDGRNTAGAAQTGGDAQGDTLWGIENIIGSGKDDVLTATNSTQFLDGGGGNDLIVASNGEVLLGGAGVDTLSFEVFNTSIAADLSRQGSATAARNNVTKGTNNIGEVSDGFSAAEFENLIGGSAGDDLVGNSGNNIIEGGAGSDTLVGGGGNDTLSYAGSANGVTVSLNGATGQALIFDVSGEAFGDKATGFIHLLGSAKGDTLTGDSRNNIITGGDGNDFLGGGDGADKLFGGAGNDTFGAELGADMIDGGTSAFDTDQVYYTSVTEAITLTLGANGAAATVSSKSLSANGDILSNIELVEGGSKDDVFTGNNLDHDFRGSFGDDTLIGGTGSSYLYGEDGNDIIYASVSNGGKGGDIGVEQYSGGNDYDVLNFSKLMTGVSIDFSGGTTSYIPGVSSIGLIFGFENAVGTAKDDVFVSYVYGTKEGMKIDAGTGNDSLTGASGADILIGNAGDDTIRDGYNLADGGVDDFIGGANGTLGDTISYIDSTGGISVNLAQQFKTDAAGTSIIATVGAVAASGGAATGDRLSGFENVLGSKVSDTIVGDANANVIEGGAGADILKGGAGFDTVSYASSTDLVLVDLNTQGTADHLGNELTAPSDQQYNGDASGDSLYDFESIIGSDHNDVLKGFSSKASTLTGGEGNDKLYGGTGVDTLNGGDDEDTFYGGGGKDIINGGESTDTVDFDGYSSGATVTLNLSAGKAATGTAGSALGMQIIDIENLFGSGGADRFVGNNDANGLSGDNGNDYLSGGGGVDILEGGEGDDTLIGGTFGDVLNGGKGFDTADYSASTTQVTINLGGQGTYVGDIDGGTVNAAGLSQVSGDASGDTFWSIERVVGSNTKGDELIGSDVNLGVTTVLDGAGGDDLIVAGIGAELLVGGAGIDTVSFDNNVTGVTVNLSNQGTYSAAGKGSITGANAVAQSGGDAAGDLLSGFENVSGSFGADTLTGSSGNNRIYGRIGTDTLTGNGGNDTFVYKNDGEGKDTISDFNAGDKLEITKSGFGIAANLSVTTFNAEYFVANASGTATFGGHGQFVYNTTTDTLVWDSNGSDAGGSISEIVAFSNNFALTAGAFTLV
jgi:Ca2+-binding RTX toxin-like protein